MEKIAFEEVVEEGGGGAPGGAPGAPGCNAAPQFVHW